MRNGVMHPSSYLLLYSHVPMGTPKAPVPAAQVQGKAQTPVAMPDGISTGVRRQQRRGFPAYYTRLKTVWQSRRVIWH